MEKKIAEATLREDDERDTDIYTRKTPDQFRAPGSMRLLRTVAHSDEKARVKRYSESRFTPSLALETPEFHAGAKSFSCANASHFSRGSCIRPMTVTSRRSCVPNVATATPLSGRSNDLQKRYNTDMAMRSGMSYPTRITVDRVKNPLSAEHAGTYSSMSIALKSSLAKENSSRSVCSLSKEELQRRNEIIKRFNESLDPAKPSGSACLHTSTLGSQPASAIACTTQSTSAANSASTVAATQPTFTFGTNTAATASTPATTTPATTQGTIQPAFSFGAAQNTTATPATTTTTSNAQPAFSFGAAQNTTATPATTQGTIQPAFSFGAAQNTTATATTTSNAQPAFSFGATQSTTTATNNAQPAFSFGAAQNTTAAATTGAQPTFTFGAGSSTTQNGTQPTFSFGAK